MNNQFGINNRNSSAPSAKTRDHPGNFDFVVYAHETNLLCRNNTAWDSKTYYSRKSDSMKSSASPFRNTVYKYLH